MHELHKDKLKQIKCFVACIVAGAWLLPVVALAQQYYDPGLLQKTVDRKPVDYQTKGVRLGSFILKPGGELGYENNDNIFYLSSSRGAGKIDDNIIHYRPWVNLTSDWSRHELNLSFYGDFARYNGHGQEDYEDTILKLDGRLDVRRGSYLSYAAASMDLHEDRSSPDDVNGVHPTEYTYRNYSAAYSHRFNRLTAVLGVETDDTNYDNNRRADGTFLSNADRDRERDTYTLRLVYEATPGRSLFVSAEANNLDYDQKTDDAGFERSSDGYAYRAGIQWDATGVLTGDLAVKYFKQSIDDPRFEKVDGFGLSGSLDWTPTRRTNVNFHFDRSPQETTQAQTSGFDSALYAVRVQQELRRNVLANVRYSYTDNNYQTNGNLPGSLRGTQVTRAGFGLSYLFNRHLYISGGYTYEKQDANTSFFEYTTNRWFITLGVDL